MSSETGTTIPVTDSLSPSLTGVEVLVLLAVVAALVGAGLAAAGIHRTEARAARWLDQRAAERVGVLYGRRP